MGRAVRPQAANSATTQQVQGKGAPRKCTDQNFASQQAGPSGSPHLRFVIFMRQGNTGGGSACSPFLRCALRAKPLGVGGKTVAPLYRGSTAKTEVTWGTKRRTAVFYTSYTRTISRLAAASLTGTRGFPAACSSPCVRVRGLPDYQ
jgi:hypothetical protein